MPELTKVQTGFLEGQGQFELDPGTEAAPGITFGDSSTGLYKSATDEVAVSVAGTQKAKFNSDGLVGNVTGNLTGNVTGESTIQSISSSITDTAVDIFIYDTSKDSDGGAWRKRTTHTSWYNETLNTATRGSRRDFPAVAVIVIESLKLTVYDGDDPDLPMWMVINADASTGGGVSHSSSEITTTKALFHVSTLNATAGLNGQMIIGTGNWHLFNFNFVDDKISFHAEYGTFSAGQAIYSTPIGGRNSSGRFVRTTSVAILSNSVNDVAMTVLPNAPIDSATGLPVPTIAVATNGGVSVIKDDGSVVDWIETSGPDSTHKLSFRKDGKLGVFTSGTSGINNYPQAYYITIPDTDVSSTYYYNFNNLGIEKYGYENETNSAARLVMKGNFGSTLVDLVDSSDRTYAATNVALNIISRPESIGTTTNMETGMIDFVTTSYNSGWMHGDIKGAFLSDTDATNQTGGTVADRSIKNTSVNVTGTITRTAVATGAELVAYSGFTNSNYLENTSFSVNFGNPPTISIMCWQKITDISDYSYFISFNEGSSVKGGISNGASASTYPGQTYFNMGNLTLYSGFRVDDGEWHCIVGTINGTAKKFYVDGKEVSSATINDHNMTGVDKIRVGSYGDNHDYPHRGSLALLRVSKSIPSPEQIKKIYEDEKVLFQENAKCTLYGSSDAVTALAYDETTSLLHVGTASGRSDFSGLKRINNTTTAVTTAISAYDSFVVEQ